MGGGNMFRSNTRVLNVGAYVGCISQNICKCLSHNEQEELRRILHEFISDVTSRNPFPLKLCDIDWITIGSGLLNRRGDVLSPGQSLFLSYFSALKKETGLVLPRRLQIECLRLLE
jgi:hypothetical protein